MSSCCLIRNESTVKQKNEDRLYDGARLGDTGDVLQAPRSEHAGRVVQTAARRVTCMCIETPRDCTSHESKFWQDVFLSKHLTAVASEEKKK